MSHQQLFVPRHCLSTFGRRAFSVDGLMAWNALPNDLCLGSDTKHRQLMGQFLYFVKNCIIHALVHLAQRRRL